MIARGNARAVRGERHGHRRPADRLLPQEGRPGAARPPRHAGNARRHGRRRGRQPTGYRRQRDLPARGRGPCPHLHADRQAQRRPRGLRHRPGGAGADRAHLRLTTPSDVMTARDTLEYWSQKHMAVAAATPWWSPTTGGGSPPTRWWPTPPARRRARRAGAGQGAAAAGRRAAIRSPPRASWSGWRRSATSRSAPRPTSSTAIAASMYPTTGIAVLVGHVRITRGQNQLNGAEADGQHEDRPVARWSADPGERVQGLVMPERRQRQPQGRGDGAARRRRPAMNDGDSRRTAARGRGGLVRARGVGKTYKKRAGGARTSRSRCVAARRWACSARTAPARPPPST